MTGMVTEAPPAPVALITGAGRRIGAEIARCLHAAGYRLGLHCRHSEAELAALTQALEAVRPDSTLTLHAELADTAALPQLVAAVQQRFGRLDALVNNASLYRPSPLGQLSEDDWDALFAANAKAPFFLAQAAAPLLRASGGCIVNISDIYAERSRAAHSLYVMAKAALNAMTRSLARELAPAVRVNALAPGAILWPSTQTASEVAERETILARTPLARLGRPAEIADTVLWLVHDAHYVTGQILTVDGGRSTLI